VSIIRTRTDLRALVTRRARIVDHLNAHPTASVNLDCDDGYRELLTLATNSRWSTYLRTTGELALPTTAAVTNETYAAIPVPTACAQVRKLEIRRGTSWYPIEEVPFGQLREFQPFPGRSWNSSAGPHVWCLLDQGVNATLVGNDATADTGVIAVTPIPTFGFYQLWYLPEFSGTSAESGANGFYVYANDDHLQYHVYSVVVKCLISDNDSEGMLKGAQEQLARYEARIMTGAPSKSGPRTWRRSRSYRV
jgi:hypothetical protein